MRVLRGVRNASQHLHSVLVVMMDYIKNNMKLWLDDCVLHSKTESGFLATLSFLITVKPMKCEQLAIGQMKGSLPDKGNLNRTNLTPPVTYSELGLVARLMRNFFFVRIGIFFDFFWESKSL
jgi:hypothetical protein